MILSFHPCFEADTNIIVAGRDPGEAELAAIRAARAVILPQGCRAELYEMAVENCPHVFPDYRARFAYPGKTGQSALFEEIRAPVPRTFAYPDLADYKRKTAGLSGQPPLPVPFVFKFSWGGEGQTVFRIRSRREFAQQLERAALFEKSGLSGFLLQAYVPHRNRSLRVVVINQKMLSYWRIQPDPDGFGTSLASGARVDRASDPALQSSGRQAARQVCRQTGINLAGFDFIFNPAARTPQAFLLEVNYFFGRTGLGGSEAFYSLLIEQIRAWLAERHLSGRNQAGF